MFKNRYWTWTHAYNQTGTRIFWFRFLISSRTVERSVTADRKRAGSGDEIEVLFPLVSNRFCGFAHTPHPGTTTYLALVLRKVQLLVSLQIKISVTLSDRLRAKAAGAIFVYYTFLHELWHSSPMCNPGAIWQERTRFVKAASGPVPSVQTMKQVVDPFAVSHPIIKPEDCYKSFNISLCRYLKFTQMTKFSNTWFYPKRDRIVMVSECFWN